MKGDKENYQQAALLHIKQQTGLYVANDQFKSKVTPEDIYQYQQWTELTRNSVEQYSRGNGHSSPRKQDEHTFCKSVEISLV